jgi:hypothetical protein
VSVGPTRGPVQRPGPDRDLAELFQRVEDLERVTPTPTGIQYDVLNVGDWLNVETTDPAPPGGLPAIYLHDSGGAGIKLLAAGGNLTLEGAGASLTSGAGLDIDAAGLLAVTAGAGATVDVTGNADVTAHGGITLTAGTSGLTSPNGVLELDAYDALRLFCSIGDIDIEISNAGSPGDRSLRVKSNAASPTEVFRVDSAGHIFMRHLPTSDPATGDGQLWKNGQVVTVST